MRKILVLMMVFGLILGSIATAEAGKKKKAPPAPVKVERVVEFDYQCPCGVSAGGQSSGFQLGSATGENIGGGPVTFDPSTENFLTATTADPSGQKVFVKIAMHLDPSNTTSSNQTVATFCGDTTDPIEMPDVEAEFRVFVYIGTCEDPTPSVPTQGTITFTLSNIP